ncbi:helix-turn-helix domain-containing protein, partial [Limosilactobacillus fermentum]
AKEKALSCFKEAIHPPLVEVGVFSPIMDKIFTQAQLLDQIWGIDSDSTEDTVKTHVSKVRKLLKDSNDVKITTIRGLGYKGEICHD